MKELNETPRNLRAVWVPMTLTALVMALLIAAAVTANPTQAQVPGGDDPGPGNTPGNTGGGNTDDSYTNHSSYDDPQPCGPGAGTAFMEEPHEITTGHYALFDAYWRTISTSSGPEGDGVGVLHTNLCPPEMIKETQRDPDNEEGDNEEEESEEGESEGEETVVITRSARNGGMDIEEAIIHVLDTHTATTVASDAGVGQISLTEYRRLRDAVDAGDRVWWLRLDDPDTAADETSDLGMGFSTLLLKEARWDSPMRYRFEVERHPADPTDVPHFFAYEAPKADGAAQDPVWDSSQPGIGVVELNPGEYKELQWVFTKPGTYLMWVHLLGDVKQPLATDDWKAISSNETETSEVYRYTIQVGTELDEIEPPIFGVNLEVEENSPGGVKVGDPIPVYNAEAKVLYYDLTGPGHSDFDLVTSTDPFTVQVVVADGADLDYETTPSYDLHLSVTDKVDHENNFNPYADDVLIVRIDLKDQDPGLNIQADKTSLNAGETVNFTARYEPTQEHSDRKFSYQLEEYIGTSSTGDRHSLWRVVSTATSASGSAWSVSVAQSSAVTKTYRATVVLPNEDTMTPTFVDSESIEITWN